MIECRKLKSNKDNYGMFLENVHFWKVKLLKDFSFNKLSIPALGNHSKVQFTKSPLDNDDLGPYFELERHLLFSSFLSCTFHGKGVTLMIYVCRDGIIGRKIVKFIKDIYCRLAKIDSKAVARAKTDRECPAK